MLIFHLRACQSGSDSGQNPSSQVFHPKSELSSPDHLGFLRLIALALVTTFILAGCSTIKVKTVTTKQSLTSQRSSILTSSELSSQTNAVLISAGTNSNQCLKSLGECVQMLSDSRVQSPSDLHGALSEIYLAFALKYESSRECRKPGSGGGTPGPRTINSFEYVIDEAQIERCTNDSVTALVESLRFSYAYLFLDDETANRRTFSDRQIMVTDFYNSGLRLIGTILYEDGKRAQQQQIQIADFVIDINEQRANLSEPVEDIQSAQYLRLENLNESVRDGFGVPYVAQLKSKKNMDLGEMVMNNFTQRTADKSTNTLTRSQSGQIVQSNFVPRTAIFKPVLSKGDTALTTRHFEFEIIDPLKHNSVNIEGVDYPLAANFSAPYALWVRNNRYEQTAYLNFFAGFEELAKPQLYMLEPYDPNKIVVIMIHGLASSPASWVNLTNDLFGDSVLRENYQVWQIFYSTNLPIIETRFDVEQLIREAYAQNRISSKDKAQNNSVIIAHSMGSIIARMLVSDDNLSDKATDELSPAQRSRLLSQKDLASRFDLSPIKPVDRVIFMSAPLRGTEYADKWYTLALRRMASLPSAFLASLSEPVINLLEGSENEKELSGFRSLFLDVAASQLSDTSTFIKITKDIQIVPGVVYHSIIGKNDDKPLEESSDGVVPYTSAHLEGAESEKIIEGGHSIQNLPQSVIEIRRILREHLSEVEGLAVSDNTIDSSIVERANQISESADLSQPEVTLDETEISRDLTPPIDSVSPGASIK